MQKHQRPRILRDFIKTRTKQAKKPAGRITIPDQKTHYKTVIINTAWYHHKNKDNQWNRMDREINSQMEPTVL